MDFDLTDLRLFLRIAEEGSLTRAAELSHMSLAAASTRVKGLEAQAKQRLLYRQPRGVRLTPPGEVFLHHAKHLLKHANRLHTDLEEYGKGLRGPVRIQANTTAVTDFLPEILSAFRASIHQVDVELKERPNPDIALGVRDGLADIGIVTGEIDTLGLRSIHFSTDRLVLVVPSGHRLAARPAVDFAETLDEDAVGMQEGCALHAFLVAASERLGKRLRPRIQVSSFDAMCRMISAGVGIGIVPDGAARRNVQRMNLASIELNDPWRIRERYILVRSGDRLASPVQALIDAIVGWYARPGDRADTPHG
ncbi:MAG: LysR family transcriptional regulator [Burkholderiaceae bacterium]